MILLKQMNLKYGENTVIKTEVRLELSYTEDDVMRAILARLPVSASEIKRLEIRKRTLNIKDKSDPHYKASVAIELDPEREGGLLKMRKKVHQDEDLTLGIPRGAFSSRPVVVGAGPAGLFAALVLAESGARPIVLERGLDVQARKKSVDEFINSHRLDENSNIQFGEGGAGAFSDGKLKYGAIDKYKMKVLSEFVLAGADEEIKYSDSAHLGTDRLVGIIENIRKKIISLGGEFRFSSRLCDFTITDGKISSLEYERDGKREKIEADTLLLGTGHSARDVFELLLAKGAVLEQRPFGVGVRVEHPREYINRIVYGENYDKRLPTASYHLVTHLESERSVYSFCMCPGGTVVAGTSSKGRVVTNGMSEYLRDKQNSNSALLVSVKPEDFASSHPLAGLDFQKEIEKKAFSLGGGDYSAPSVTMADFLGIDKVGEAVNPSYPLGTKEGKLEDIFPSFITDSLRLALYDFDAWLPGFIYPQARLTAPETRSTSPVRVVRDAELCAVNIKGLYPIGEGAGYAGGIVSSATDGVKCALRIVLEKTQP